MSSRGINSRLDCRRQIQDSRLSKLSGTRESVMWEKQSTVLPRVMQKKSTVFWENISLVAGTARQNRGQVYPPPLPTSPCPIRSQEKSIFNSKSLGYPTLNTFQPKPSDFPKFPPKPQKIAICFKSDFRLEFGEIVVPKFRAFVPKGLKSRFRKDSARFRRRIEPQQLSFHHRRNISSFR